MLKQVNNLSGTKIRTGTGLLVPVASQNSNAYALAKPHPLYRKKKKVLAGKAYTVRPGDSMWVLSQRFNTSVSAIAQVNQVSQRHQLKIGQTIFLPTSAKPESRPPKATPAAPRGTIIAVAARRERRVYTVRTGDTLWIISKRFNLRINDIRAWNQLREGKHLMPGQVLKLHSPVDQKES